LIQLFHRFLNYRNIFLPVIFVITAGVLGGFIAATGLLALMLIIKKKNTLELLFVLLIFTFFLGDNFRGPFAYMQNFRFVMVLFSFLYLLKYNLIKNSVANYLLPFTIIAFCVTLLFSPIGIAAVFRSLGFWLVGLVIFKLAKLLYLSNTKRVSELLMLALVLYFTVNLLLVFISFENGYMNGRFRGLTANPNGLCMIAMFSYAIITLIEKRKDITLKKTFLALKILLFFIIFITGSRTAFFSVLFFELVNRLLKNKVLLFLAIAVFVFLYLVIESIASFQVFEFLESFDFIRIETLADGSGRTEVWPVVWEEISNAPFFGNGILYDDYFIKDYVSTNIGEYASRHWGGVWNSYLSLLLDVGVIGCIAYVYFWIIVFKKSHYKNIAIAFIAMCLLSGFTESWMAASMNAFTPMMFLFWAIQLQPATNK